VGSGRRTVMRSKGTAGALTLSVASMLALTAQPASATGPSTLSFSGYTWIIKSGPHRQGPGPNYFSASNSWVDTQGHLHLAITKQGTEWTVGEVYGAQSLGYGTYTWVVGSRVDNIDPNMVLGLFTWANPAAHHHREIDVEVSRWNKPTDPTNAQFVVQPYFRKHNLVRITEGPTVPATFSFHWTATSLTFYAPGATPVTWNYTGKSRPPAGGGVVADMNFWLNNGQSPMYGGGGEVVIDSFTFTPG
jgi:hypothetical protein